MAFHQILELHHVHDPDHDDPGLDPVPLYYTTLGAAVLVFLGLRYASRTPFGLALQGLRDEPNRMRALGFNVTLHRILAFTLAAFVAAYPDLPPAAVIGALASELAAASNAAIETSWQRMWSGCG